MTALPPPPPTEYWGNGKPPESDYDKMTERDWMWFRRGMVFATVSFAIGWFGVELLFL